MAVLQLTVDLGATDPVPVEDLLASLGAVSVTLMDAGDDPVLEPAPGETPLWPRTRLTAHFASDVDRQAILSSLASLLPPPVEPRFEVLADRAWEREWLRDFGPMRFGRRLWVCPEDQPAGDQQAIRVALDPGLAFGTGSHATTALCLEWLDGCELAGRRVIDYGCGSGILAIAALKLGAVAALAFDIDPQALTATRENAERNGVAKRLTIAATAPIIPACCDVLVANILAGPLIDLASRFATLVQPGGLIALSGILGDQAQQVATAYGSWFKIGATTARDGWALLSGSRGHIS